MARKKRSKHLLTALSFLFLVSPACVSCGKGLDYSLYYSYKGNMKGIEVYCWKKNNHWSSGMLPGTNRQKWVDEVEWLQENLPCPLKEMAKILSTYSEEERAYAAVRIVSVPPLYEELNNFKQESQMNDYKYLYAQLGLEFKV